MAEDDGFINDGELLEDDKPIKKETNEEIKKVWTIAVILAICFIILVFYSIHVENKYNSLVVIMDGMMKTCICT